MFLLSEVALNILKYEILYETVASRPELEANPYTYHSMTY